MTISYNQKRESPSSSGDALVTHTPEDIVVNILLRLPVKSLLRFTVCKSWQVTINSNPRFIHQQYLTRSTLNADSGNLLLRRRVSTITKNLKEFLHLDSGHGSSQISNDVRVPYSFEDSHVASVRSSDGGLLFLEVLQRSRVIMCYYVIWKPATRLVKKIHSEKLQCEVMSPRFVGFGVVTEDCNYKLVSIQIYKKNAREKGNNVLIQIYSKLSGSWREIDATAFPMYNDIWSGSELSFPAWGYDSMGLAAKGVVYWILGKPKIIVGFNIRDKVCLQLAMPELHGNVGVIKLADIKGSLALITLPPGGSYSVRKMSEGADQAWVMMASTLPFPQYLVMLGYWKSFLFVFIDRNENGLFIRKPNADGSNFQEISSSNRGDLISIHDSNYVESLIPVQYGRDAAHIYIYII